MQGVFRAGRLKPAQKPALSTAIQNGMACGGFQSVIGYMFCITKTILGSGSMKIVVDKPTRLKVQSCLP
jgi:hypothetical protein